MHVIVNIYESSRVCCSLLFVPARRSGGPLSRRSARAHGACLSRTTLSKLQLLCRARRHFDISILKTLSLNFWQPQRRFTPFARRPTSSLLPPQTHSQTPYLQTKAAARSPSQQPNYHILFSRKAMVFSS